LVKGTKVAAASEVMDKDYLILKRASASSGARVPRISFQKFQPRQTDFHCPRAFAIEIAPCPQT